MSKATQSSYYNVQGQRDRWPVLVYRLQSHRGWQVYCDPDMEASSKKGGKIKEELTASPREGCIEVRKMRLRIRLFEQQNPAERKESDCATVAGTIAGTQDDGAAAEDGTENETNNARCDNDIPGKDGWNNNAMVVRRLNTLLISTRRGMAAIVFKFKTKQDCIEFCDRLVYVNRDYFKKNALNEIDDGCVSGSDFMENHCNQLREAKRRRLSVLEDQQMAAEQSRSSGKNDDNTGNVHSSTLHYAKQARRKDELLSYIVRLSHDEDFLGFVDEIERGLQSAPETAGVYNAMRF